MGQQRVTVGLRFVGVVALAVAASVLGLGPASAAPRALPAPVAHLLAGAHQPVARHAATTGARHALRIPGEDDGQSYVGVDARCAVGKHKARLTAVVVTPTRLKLDYVLTGHHVRKAGTVKTKADRPVPVKLPSVRKGAYRLTVAVHGSADLVSDQSFDVLPCVVVKTSCHAVTFTNPAGNPGAYVTYAGHKKDQQFDLDLAPGASRTVRADYSKVDYETYSDDAAGATGSLGHGTVKVKQKCAHGPAQPAQHAVQTRGVAGCSVSGGTAVVTLGWSAQPSLSARRFQVLDAAQQVVTQGSFTGGRDSDLSLAAGTYTYRSFANGLAQPFEDVTFDVFACVTVTPLCRAVQVQNPNAVDLGVLVLSTDDEETEVAGDGQQTTVPAGGTVTIPWTGSTAWVLALGEDALSGPTDFVSVAFALTAEGDPATTSVPQDC